ncbi:hypothetical protein [Mesorhizobium neociceri]|uniref:Uncharacterized protein n=1 Tax=Mesorhizobium neociceri TaxID=1307853 RepID=A0A838AZY0_9HYPH|nr:hypothetical protein [Mesorhizobium neociceri]MBA1139986.1 hypothetical protein [Mesorhizobium neociceri]
MYKPAAIASYGSVSGHQSAAEAIKLLLVKVMPIREDVALPAHKKPLDAFRPSEYVPEARLMLDE